MARHLGVTKGSFYHHFKNRQHLLDRAVELWAERATEKIIETVDAAAGTARTRLVMLAQEVFPANDTNDAIEVSLRDWSANDEGVAKTIARVDERRLSYVEGLLRDAGVERARERSELLYRTLIGEFVYRRGGGDPLSEGAVALLTGLLLAQPVPL